VLTRRRGYKPKGSSVPQLGNCKVGSIVNKRIKEKGKPKEGTESRTERTDRYMDARFCFFAFQILKIRR
jgi:hypothetical protein